jgi:serine/threonine-protein kinase
MTEEAARWRRVKEVLQSALERSREDRPGFLRDACRDDDTLRTEVESLLLAHERAGRFAERPALETLAPETGDPGQPDSGYATLRPGTQLGPYEVDARIGAGGMGEVYRARDTRLDRLVAIKIPSAALQADPAFRQRFEREARTLARVGHPNICAVFDVGRQDGVEYFVMEYFEGETLAARVRRGALDMREALHIARQIAGALEAAHRAGVVHRDLKPGNVMLARTGGQGRDPVQAKLLDFGLGRTSGPPASAVDAAGPAEQPSLTTQGTLIGTCDYMAPEQIEGRTADARSDIFAFGIVLYEMLTARRPFAGATPAAVFGAILKDDPAPVSTLRPETPALLDHLVRRCLAKDPDDRWQTAGDLVSALKWISERPPESKPRSFEGPRHPLLKPGAPRTVAAVMRAIALLVLGALAGVGWFSWSQSRESPDILSIAVLPLENSSSDPEQEYFADGMTNSLTKALRQISALTVKSAMFYKGSKTPWPQILKELGVDAVIRGSVQKSGDRVSIFAELVHASTNQVLWVDDYEKELTNILSLQSEIARTVASEVGVALSPQEETRLAAGKPVDPEVHDLYLKGLFHMNRGTEEELDKAIEFFKQATEKDDKYAPAWAGLADSYIFLSDRYRRPKEVMPLAEKAARKALELDEDLAEAHSALTTVLLQLYWDWPGAERAADRAIRLAPSSGLARVRHANVLSATGRHEEAVAEARRAQQYDPNSVGVNFRAGFSNFYAGEFDQAIVEFKKAIDLEPRFGFAHAGIAISEAQKEGRLAEAVEAAQTAVQVDESPLVLAMAAGVYAAAGKAGMALELKKRSMEEFVCAYEIAIIHINLGETEDALDWLVRAADDKPVCMPYAKVDPRLEPIHSHPRYVKLIRRMGLAD